MISLPCFWYSPRSEVMTWRMINLLPRFADQPEFAPITNYLAGERRELRSYELSRKIAYVFDQYLAFRPHMILDWERGGGEDWQAVLWRELQRTAPGEHQVALGLQLVEALKRGTRVPERADPHVDRRS